MSFAHELTVESRSRSLTWRVIPCKPDDSLLPPVVVSTRVEPFNLQDYFTPEQAEELGRNLIAAAEHARELAS